MKVIKGNVKEKKKIFIIIIIKIYMKENGGLIKMKEKELCILLMEIEQSVMALMVTKMENMFYLIKMERICLKIIKYIIFKVK